MNDEETNQPSTNPIEVPAPAERSRAAERMRRHRARRRLGCRCVQVEVAEFDVAGLVRLGHLGRRVTTYLSEPRAEPRDQSGPMEAKNSEHLGGANLGDHTIFAKTDTNGDIRPEIAEPGDDPSLGISLPSCFSRHLHPAWREPSLISVMRSVLGGRAAGLSHRTNIGDPRYPQDERVRAMPRDQQVRRFEPVLVSKA
jgi:hypothetical protein